MLSLADLREPAIRSAIKALKLPSGSRGLDVGCGIGHHTLWLAKAVAPAGHVTGLDLSPELLAGYTFVTDVHAPLSEGIRSALTATFQMFWGEAQSEVTKEDWVEFERLCQPESPDFI